ncbi:MAG: glycosyltransferase [Candidatus Marinimicrobia bacterium]|nr:glycosyltransferase [Candidatus Neomarinimicrobiota bacterium]
MIANLIDIARTFLSAYYEIFYDLFKFVIIAYFLLLNFSYLLTTIISFKFLREYVYRLKSIVIEDLIFSSQPPPVTLLAPAYNEAATIVESVKSLMYLNYPDYEVIVINDGSKDATLDKLKNAYQLKKAARGPLSEIETAEIKQIYQSQRYPNLWVIDKENGGKADALNTGINYCQTPLFCAMDSDSILEKDALIRLVRPFLENENTVAAGGIIRVVNGCKIKSGQVTDVKLPKNILAGFQTTEYLRAFLSGRMGWDVLNATLIISGAFGIFQRKTAVKVNGYDTSTVGEDMDLVVKMHHYCQKIDQPYKVTYVPDPVAWTEVPEDLTTLGKQRQRWQIGLYQTMTKHKEMLLNPKYGLVGMVAFPYFYFLEMLGPLIELPGYILLGIAIILGKVAGIYTVLLLMVAFVFGITLSIVSIGLEEMTFRRFSNLGDLAKLYLLAILENFGFRQMTAYWRIKGILAAIRGTNSGWGEMKRKGFGNDS